MIIPKTISSEEQSHVLCIIFFFYSLINLLISKCRMHVVLCFTWFWQINSKILYHYSLILLVSKFNNILGYVGAFFEGQCCWQVVTWHIPGNHARIWITTHYTWLSSCSSAMKCYGSLPHWNEYLVMCLLQFSFTCRKHLIQCCFVLVKST